MENGAHNGGGAGRPHGLVRLLGAAALALGMAGLAAAQSGRVAAPTTGRPAQAAGPVRVYAVPRTGHALNFVVPQVQLADAALAHRINTLLARRSAAANAEVDSLASPARQVQLAARNCCYDPETRRWEGNHGLTGCSYVVLLNQGGLLSLEIALESTGAYSWERTEHLTFDLRTGRLLTLADMVADSPTQLSQRLSWAINRRLGNELAEMVKYSKQDTARIAYAAEQFQWDWTTHQSRNADLGLGDPAEFALTPQKLLLFYRIGFPHAALDLEPDNTYRFGYGTLQVRPRLRAALARPVASPKKQ